MRAVLALATLLVVGLAGQAAHAQCGEPGAQLQVFVKGKTAVRRGPGLNYPVSAFVEDGRCMKASDISIDGNWVMIDDPVTKGIGWVSTKQLDPASIEVLSTQRPKKSGPVGSGQERGYLKTLRPVGLLAAPKRGAKDKRTLPANARVLALAITNDKEWVQVRNERNETGWIMAVDLEDGAGTIAGLPVADNGLETGIAITPASAEAPEPAASGGGGGAASSAGSGGSSSAAAPAGGGAPAADDGDRGIASKPDRPAPSASDQPGVAFELQIMGMFALPKHGLESDGNSGLRRYALRANGGGGFLALRATHIGPIEARVEYGLVVIGGLATSAEPTDVVSGQQHDARLLFGVPITLGPIEIVPEFGYTGQIFAMSPALKTRDEPTFFSHHSHLVTLGARLVLDIVGYVRLSGELHGLFGATTEYPFDLGESGLTGGWNFGLGGTYAMSPDFGIVARFDMRSVRAPFVGPAPIDVTITTARLVHAEQQFSAGVMFRF